MCSLFWEITALFADFNRISNHPAQFIRMRALFLCLFILPLFLLAPVLPVFAAESDQDPSGKDDSSEDTAEDSEELPEELTVTPEEVEVTSDEEVVVAPENDEETGEQKTETAEPAEEEQPVIQSVTVVQPDPAALVGDIDGRVQVKAYRNPVVYATVTIKGTDHSVITDAKGKFRFERVPPGTYTLMVKEETIENYSREVTVYAGKTAKARFYVNTFGYLLDEVIVTGEKEKGEIASKAISKEELDSIPGAGGDVIRVIENLPGVASAPVSGQQGLVIRGTSAEDSRYLYNGFELPSLFHFGALISIINSELIEDITYYPGGFGVQYGGATGGVIEVSNRSPRTDRYGGIIDLSTYSAFALAEGPIGDKFSWAGAVRRSTIDFILPEVIPEDQANFTVAPAFYDYTLILEGRPNEQNRVQGIFLGTDDRVSLIGDFENEDPFSANSFEYMTTWHRGDILWDFAPNSTISNRLGASLLYAESRFDFGKDFWFGLKAWWPQVRIDFSVKAGKWNEVRLGVEAAYQNADITANIIRPPKEGETNVSILNEDTVEITDQFENWLVGAYVDDVMEPVEWAQIIPGVRWDYNDTLGDSTFDPRLALKFFPIKKLTLKGSGGVYHQWPGDDEMADTFGTTNLDAETAYQGALGFEYNFGNEYKSPLANGFSIDLQGYYKHLEHLVSPTESGNDEPYANTGKGYVWGMELLARKKLTNRLFGWISYTYSQSRRKDREDLDWRYFDLDQAHNFIIVASYKFGKDKTWKLGGRWQYSTGLPYTDIEGALYNADTDSYIPIYSEDTNEMRYRDHHQLDIRLDKLWKFNTWALLTYLDVQNVYWQEYPIGYMYNHNYSEKKSISYPTFMPSLGLQAQF